MRQRDCAIYLVGGGTAMMADNIEHVITYWVLWQEFHSPGLVAFEVISHWAPFLLFSVHAGSLADRFDCRRVIQVAQLLFMAVSLGWGIAFATGTLSIPLACVLLVFHGLAGSLWGPAEQLMLQDFVGRNELESAVRLNATFRSLGILFGPVVGSALLVGLGATAGMFVNVAIYLPLTIFLGFTKFTGHTREGIQQRSRMTLRAAGRVLRYTAHDQVLLAMIALGGLGSFFIGAALQSVMPIFADKLGAGAAGVTYGVLLFAAGAGGVAGGLLLELFRFVRPTVPAAVISTAVYGISIGLFAMTSNYALAVMLLFIGGVANLAAMSISQTVTQLMAPSQIRGQVIGVYNMTAQGLRIGSGFTVGLMAGVIGASWALATSSAGLIVGTAALIVVIWRGRRRAAVSEP
jgi:MFS family permease